MAAHFTTLLTVTQIYQTLQEHFYEGDDVTILYRERFTISIVPTLGYCCYADNGIRALSCCPIVMSMLTAFCYCCSYPVCVHGTLALTESVLEECLVAWPGISLRFSFLVVFHTSGVAQELYLYLHSNSILLARRQTRNFHGKIVTSSAASVVARIIIRTWWGRASLTMLRRDSGFLSLVLGTKVYCRLIQYDARKLVYCLSLGDSEVLLRTTDCLNKLTEDSTPFLRTRLFHDVSDSARVHIRAVARASRF